MTKRATLKAWPDIRTLELLEAKDGTFPHQLVTRTWRLTSGCGGEASTCSALIGQLCRRRRTRNYRLKRSLYEIKWHLKVIHLCIFAGFVRHGLPTAATSKSLT